jgi:murein DD-endopeptidase MepM/ murein hydrolase activator NlpD
MNDEKVRTTGNCRKNAIPMSRFSEFMARENGLDRHGFQAWVFLPGMLFNSREKWWGDGGKRTRPHEGLDFCLFNDGRRVFRLGEGTRIPAMYDGNVVAIIDDFLGRSIVLRHRLSGNGGPFLTIYGHTVVKETLRLETLVREGEIIGRLADSGKSKGPVYPHLHVSLARPSGCVDYTSLAWRDLDNPRLFAMIDPRDFMDGSYLLLDGIEEIPEPFNRP